ncbi:hypothetical protein CEE44_04815 [Candidatus Woesearchaeota archaeon B3_Woes]|nr:MAG: hypothetical protein CEE44_04815 [Candidatus Woesearchaeota archaeon B3_Woes]
MNNKEEFDRWFSEFEKESAKYQQMFNELMKIDLKSLTEEELWDKHNRIWQQLIRSRRISMMMDPIMFSSERRMIKELEDYCKKEKIKDVSKIYSTLTSPEKASFLNFFEIELIDIAKKIKGSDLLDNPEEFVRLDIVKKHINKYFYAKGNWGYGYRYSVGMVIEGIKELLKEDLDELEKKKRQLSKENKKIRKELLDKYRFSNTIRSLSDLSVFVSYWQELRKENALKFIYYETRFAKEFSRRYELDVKDIMLFDIKEVEEFVKDKEKFLIEVEKRKKPFLLIHTLNKLEAIYGEKVKYYFDKVVSLKDPDKISEIKGVCASPGKATGKVRIVNTVEEFSKFKKGDVLVTGMTRPEYVGLMKKAAAIVTSDGGITSHAAIVSRELGKPCVTGTNIALKVLKDGDLVEVDAEKGVVRKLK